VLANVMPGLRELRAPLAAGYLWLVVAWLVFGGAVPTKDEVQEPLDRLYELEPVVSDLGRAVVASVAAYVIGSIVIDLQGRFGPAFGRLIERQRDNWPLATLTFPPAGRRVLDSMFPESRVPPDFRQQMHEEAAWRDEARNEDERQTSQRNRAALVNQYWDNVRRNDQVRSWVQTNRAVTKTRLLDLSEPLHSEVDRPDAEATFRMALWPPLSGLTIYLMITVSTGWIAALLLPALLAWQWFSLRRRANAALITAIAARPELRESLIEDVKRAIDDENERTLDANEVRQREFVELPPRRRR
jgi:hypothetical protein